MLQHTDARSYSEEARLLDKQTAGCPIHTLAVDDTIYTTTDVIALHYLYVQYPAVACKAYDALLIQRRPTSERCRCARCTAIIISAMPRAIASYRTVGYRHSTYYNDNGESALAVVSCQSSPRLAAGGMSSFQIHCISDNRDILRVCYAHTVSLLMSVAGASVAVDFVDSLLSGHVGYR